MEYLVNLKRGPDEIDHTKCILCQEEDINSILRHPSPEAQGLIRLRECAQERLKLKDENRLIIDRVLYCDRDRVCYHKHCYSTFTSKKHISRLKSVISNESKESAIVSLRSSVPKLSWNKCIFCQEEKTDKLKTIMVLEGTSKKILDASKYHKILSVKLANVIDLVAAGPAKYHLKCYSKFIRDTASIKESADRNGKAMAWLISEIKHYAKKGHVLHLDEVYHYYETLCTESNEEMPTSFLSRKCTFKEKLSELLIGIYEFHTLEYGKGTVMVPTEFIKTPISKLLSQECDECEVGLPLYKPDDDIILSLNHVALKLSSYPRKVMNVR